MSVVAGHGVLAVAIVTLVLRTMHKIWLATAAGGTAPVGMVVPAAA